jgi:hypothetical protein
MDKDDFLKWCNGNNRKKKIYRMPNFQNTCPAQLKDYKLTFNYYSESRCGGAANIMESQGDCVYGLLSEIENNDLETIRDKEGFSEDCTKCYYNEVCVSIEKLDGNIIQFVKTYKVSKCREKLKHQLPTKIYMDLIINNAKKYEFPPDYISYLKSIPIKS